ncbi:unnamed protein product [Oppiella nova]|uniref:Uncharacterized protein n=1 Tax=Oppiella nova TaxID=334625 RepID=A0A7R9QWR4_9ACAR|nr:unnamed protein product [Oppiella nova]CAG2177899.1 unnamed protein product [Oppiella nova]
MSGHYSGRSASASPVPPQRNRRFLTGVSCDNAIYGCSARLSSPEERIIHKDLCDFEPNSCVKCIECHKEMKRSQLRRHNCIEELRAAVEELKDIITALEAKVNQQSIHLNEAKQILDASPHQILTHRQLKEKWIESYDRDNDPKREVVFESEPDLTFKEVRHLSGLSDTQVLPEVNAYKRYDKQMATDVDDFGIF